MDCFQKTKQTKHSLLEYQLFYFFYIILFVHGHIHVTAVIHAWKALHNKVS